MNLTHAFTVSWVKYARLARMTVQFAAAEQTPRLISEDSLDFGSFEPNKHFIFKEAQTINRMNNFETCRDVANFTSFDKGDLLARDGDENLTHSMTANILFSRTLRLLWDKSLTDCRESTDRITRIGVT